MREMSKSKTGNGSPQRSTRSKARPLPIAGRPQLHVEPEVTDPPEGPPKTHVVEVGTTSTGLTITQSSPTVSADADFVYWDFGGEKGSVVLKGASKVVKNLRPHSKGQVADIFSTVPGSYEFEVIVKTFKRSGFLVLV